MKKHRPQCGGTCQMLQKRKEEKKEMGDKDRLSFSFFALLFWRGNQDGRVRRLELLLKNIL